ncbi:two-component system, response regulator, stage 0 sporulation protein F [Oceanobacillus limi]|uniref:Two-component system, response regulator, stage 0 sporulation protein F n=1 Tax=Oceanobacillus limi TaxID=930131 RepID=A0A1I0G920_9BACI|nr:response regulator [Oceanobacillus limi]SET66414.1 two-component system, response regulator, stage 0 sporulation protein F [Oceanobacillus limi]
MDKEILVVDDEHGIRLLLEDILTNEGYKVITAKTGKEALDKLNAHSISLMILDYKLPIVDGLEILKKLDREKTEVPTVVMSGLVEKITEETKDISNVKSILAKPFNVLDVVQEVQSILA